MRLDSDEDGPVLEIHLVAESGSDLATVGEAVARAGATYLARTTGTPDHPRRGAHRRRRHSTNEGDRPHHRQQGPPGSLLLHLHVVAGPAGRSRAGPQGRVGA